MSSVDQLGSGNKSNIWVIDPNPINSKLIPNEDLFIYASLRVKTRNRSIIETTDSGFNVQNLNNDNDTVEINFIGTKTDSDGEYLSTDWTDIGGNIPGVNKKTNRELLGIKSINITYGADLLPKVDIVFLDLKGGALFDGYEYTDKNGNKSNTSDYNVFFQLPYPVFELTIKGYYGKAVTYCLHMTKWSGNFVDGNFEIKANFLGFTYAFLADILMGYVKAVNDTEEGYQTLKEVFRKNSPDKTPTSITEFLKTIGNLEEFVKDLKSNTKTTQGNIGYQTLLSLNESITKLYSIKNKIGLPRLNPQDGNYTIIEGEYIQSSNITKNNVYFFRDFGVFDYKQKNIYEDFYNDLKADISSYEQSLPQEDENIKDLSIFTSFGMNPSTGIWDNILTSPNSNPNIVGSGDTSIFYNLHNLLTGSIDTKKEYLDQGYVDSSQTKPDQDPLWFRNNISSSWINENSPVLILDFVKLRRVVSELITKSEEKRNKLSEDVSKQLNSEINKQIGFNPTIKNVFEILTNNVEAYLKTLYNVSFDAEKRYETRGKIINKKLSDNPNRVFAWPMIYNEKGDEVYMGNDPRFKENDFPEIKFINKVTNNLVKRGSLEKNITLKKNKVWFPINTNDYIDTPYSISSLGSQGLVEFSNILLNRSIIAYDYSGYKNDQFIELARTEAAICYESIIDKTNRDALSNFLENRRDEILINGFTNSIIGEPLLSVSGDSYYTNSNVINLFSNYQVTSNISSSPSLFFEVMNFNNENPSSNDFFNRRQESLYETIINSTNQNINDVFKPKQTKTSRNLNEENQTSLDSRYWTPSDSISRILWSNNVIEDEGVTPNFTKLSNFIGYVYSDVNKQTYFLSESSSYQSANVFSGNTDFDDYMIRAYMILSTFPFEKLDRMIEALSDVNKIIDIEFSYLAWLGGIITRQENFKKNGIDPIKELLFNSNEFSNNQGVDVNEYLSIGIGEVNTLKLKQNVPSGKLPKPFNDINNLNESIINQLKRIFLYWVIDNKSLIDKFLDVNNKEDILNNLNNYFKNVITQVKLVSHTPNFWLYNDKDNFSVPSNKLSQYIDVFADKFIEINQKNGQTSTRNDVNQLDNAVIDPDLKYQTYKHFKNIYDKWIGGTKDGKIFNACSFNIVDSNKSLIDYFQFIDRGFNDISDKAVINLNSLLVLNEDQSISFYNLIGRVLRDSKFDFHVLPTFINYRDINDVLSVFEPITIIDKQTQNLGPSFIAMYSAGNSKLLDLGNRSDYANDGYDFTNVADVSSKLKEESNNPKNLVAFRVGFGDENQSIFKNISINQEEFSETDESLRVMSDYVDKKGGTQRVFKGTNLYNVYSVRSYNVNVDMLGNAMIQPLMYFQLDNVPMFHGAYLVLNVTHNISPNRMDTTFRGVRQSKMYVPIVEEATSYLSINLEEKLKRETITNTIRPDEIIAPDIDNNIISNYVNPLDNIQIVSKLGYRVDPNNPSIKKFHSGVDLLANNGTLTKASWGGNAVTLSNPNGYGTYVIIDHGQLEDGFYYYTLYAHLSEILISGQVRPGQIFAKTGGIKGAPGSGNSKGPHLHYEIRRSSDRVNVNQYFNLTALNPEMFFKDNLSSSSINDNQNPLHGELT